MKRRLVVPVLAAIAVLAGCGAGDPDAPAPRPQPDPDHRALHPQPGYHPGLGLPRQVGTDGNVQVVAVTAHQRELVARNAVKVSPARGSGTRGSASASPTRSRTSRWC